MYRNNLLNFNLMIIQRISFMQHLYFVQARKVDMHGKMGYRKLGMPRTLFTFNIEYNILY